MNWLIDYYGMFGFIVIVLLVIGYAIKRFTELSKEKQVECIKVWLLQAVIEMEKLYGSNTGQMKFSKLYDLFVVRFPVISKFISRNTLNLLVEQALSEMRHLLETNEQIMEYVEGGK